MKSNTGMNESEIPFEQHRVFFAEENKKILRPVILAFSVVLTTLLFLNLAAAGFGYKTSINKNSSQTVCEHPDKSIRYYVLPGYVAGCWLGSK